MLPEERITVRIKNLVTRLGGSQGTPVETHEQPHPEPDTTPIADVTPDRPVTIEGRLHELTEHQHDTPRVVIATGELVDDTGTVLLEFHYPCDDLEAGQLLRLNGSPRPGPPGRPMTISDPHYRILEFAEQAEEDENTGSETQ